jgi:hypothetical protein
MVRLNIRKVGAITELAESQVSEQTIMVMAGHVSPKMVAHYSHMRLAAKRAALNSLARPHVTDSNPDAEQGSNVTIQVTNGKRPDNASPYVVEKIW